MPREVFIDKYSRLNSDNEYQTWFERISEVVAGNFSLDPRNKRENVQIKQQLESEFKDTLLYGRLGLLAMSGRHLQHGDLDQANKVGELFTNCSSALFSFNKFLLLLKGSGVGRSYDSDIHFIDWDYMPNVRFVLSSSHPDYQDWIESYEEAQHKYDSEGEDTRWFDVGDSAEGWTKVITILETASFHKNNVDNLFVFNFTPVRCEGTPIKGQQGRPASGPVPLIKALMKVATVKGAGFKPWMQALFIDHYLSACVALGGIRRSARIATKYWKDRDVIDFINIKRGGWLYTANNSVMVDEEFWKQAADPRPSHARRVFEAVVAAAYWDQTGEPGFINVDKLVWNNEGVDKITVDTFIDADYQKRLGGLHTRTKDMIHYVLAKAKAKKYFWIVNPCAEIVKAAYGSYCIVGDVALSNASSMKQAKQAIMAMGRMLVRTNLMNFMYKQEIQRTNRIGTSLIGIHEFAANIFNFDFFDLINEKKSQRFWNFLAECRVAHKQYVDDFCDEIGVSHPHTYTCLKPAGTVAKVMDCTEAANLPSMPIYMRWIQFKKDHPLLKDYAERGYPVRDISKDEERTNDKGETYTVRGYPDVCIVGFPTMQPIANILGDRLVCATDITIEQHFKWLQLLEKYWLGEGENNQISYTLKYDPAKVSYSEFIADILKYQPHVRCCAVMPQVNDTAYIYTPEEAITREQYNNYMSHINRADREAVDDDSLNCIGGACGVDYSKNKSIAELTEMQNK